MVKPLYYNRLTNFSRFPLEIPKPALSVLKLVDGCLDPLLKQVAFYWVNGRTLKSTELETMKIIIIVTKFFLWATYKIWSMTTLTFKFYIC